MSFQVNFLNFIDQNISKNNKISAFCKHNSLKPKYINADCVSFTCRKKPDNVRLTEEQRRQIEKHADLLNSIASQYLWTGMDYGDLVELAQWGLVDGASRYIEGDFKSFVKRRMRGAILDEYRGQCRNRANLNRIPKERDHIHLGVSSLRETVLQDDPNGKPSVIVVDGNKPFAEVDARLDNQVYMDHLENALSPLQMEIFNRKFLLGEDREDIAKALGIDKATVNNAIIGINRHLARLANKLNVRFRKNPGSSVNESHSSKKSGNELSDNC